MMIADTPAVAQETSFRVLYIQAFPVVAAFVRKMNGTRADAYDVFHDALVIYYEKHRHDPAQNPAGYILGIAKHLWIRKYHRDKRHVALDDAEKSITLPDDYFPSIDDTRLLQFLQSTGERCLQLLHAFYYEQRPLKKIAALFGFGSERSATVQKYKCLEKLRDKVKEKTIAYEDFFE